MEVQPNLPQKVADLVALIVGVNKRMVILEVLEVEQVLMISLVLMEVLQHKVLKAEIVEHTDLDMLVVTVKMVLTITVVAVAVLAVLDKIIPFQNQEMVEQEKI
jgi:hypothetical protein